MPAWFGPGAVGKGAANSGNLANGLPVFRVLTDAIGQLPPGARAKILIRIDGAGATHDLLAHIEALNTSRRTVRYTVGWTITDADESAIAALPANAWTAALHQDATAQPESGRG